MFYYKKLCKYSLNLTVTKVVTNHVKILRQTKIIPFILIWPIIVSFNISCNIILLIEKNTLTFLYIYKNYTDLRSTLKTYTLLQLNTFN